jgi:hypothetical protein
MNNNKSFEKKNLNFSRWCVVFCCVVLSFGVLSFVKNYVEKCKCVNARLVSAVVTNGKLQRYRQFQTEHLLYGDTVMGIKSVAREAKLFNNY